MEHAHQAAIAAGLTDEQFWSSTPYNVGLRVQAVEKARLRTALHTGWFVQRFACEERLQGPQHYLKVFFEPGDDAEGEAMAEAELARMALQWGLDLVDLDEEPAAE